MKMLKLEAQKISWTLDFSPSRKNPAFLPVFCVETPEGLVALSGFNQKNEASVSVVILEHDQTAAPKILGEIPTLMDSLWNPETLGALEALRYQKALGRPVHYEFLLSWPLEFQNFLDQKQMPLKNLRPLEGLREWQKEVADVILRLQPSSSQIREILDLLCDLKFMGHSWNEVSSFSSETSKWMMALRKLRTPVAAKRDDTAAEAVRALPWPRGTMARWERQGDQSALVFQARVTNLKEWQRLQENLRQINIGESLWN